MGQITRYFGYHRVTIHVVGSAAENAASAVDEEVAVAVPSLVIR
jgi:hypothetical protein